MTTIHAPEPRSAIEAAGNLPDAELDIAAVALQLARVDAPDADWRQVAAHFSDIARSVVEAATLDSKADKGDLEARRLILAEALHGRFGYQGDSETYDDMANANLIRVVERRRGLPVALGILWLHAADAAGWAAYGVDFPGHFLLALEGPRGKLILDVFAGGKVLEAQDLRALIKRVEGEKAELRPGVLRPMTRREVPALAKQHQASALAFGRNQDRPGRHGRYAAPGAGPSRAMARSGADEPAPGTHWRGFGLPGSLPGIGAGRRSRRPGPRPGHRIAPAAELKRHPISPAGIGKAILSP